MPVGLIKSTPAHLAANARYVKTPEGRKKARTWARNYARTPKAKALRRSMVLRKKYGLTSAQWNEMFLAQGCRCKICGMDNPGSRYGWKTDHNHETGRVRGILCHGCNIALGGVRDNKETLLKMAAYLEGG